MLNLNGKRDLRIKTVHAGLHLVQHRPRGVNTKYHVFAAVGSIVTAFKELEFLVELDYLLTEAGL